MNIDDDIKLLMNQFYEISNKRWIKSISKSFGGIGLTFEKQLKKNLDSLYFPDYYGIEIKCTSRYSRYPLYLFTAAFDGPTFPEINRIVDTYGYYDKVYTDKKVLFEKLSCKSYQLVNNQYYFRMEVDRMEEKLYLCIYNLNHELIEKSHLSIYNHCIII